MTSLPIIALVENDTHVLQALGRLLRAAGLPHEGYGSAEEFLARASAAPVACLVADIDLNGMSGLDLHAQLLAGGGAPPVVYVTSQPDPALRERAEALGCRAYLRKPCSAAQLFAVLPQSPQRPRF